MYTQSLWGPRYFLPKNFDSVKFDFYKNKNEILFERPDAEFVNNYNLK